MPAHLDALKKAIANNLVIGEVPVGVHHFNDRLELHVQGSAKRSPNSFIKPTAKLPIVNILALVIQKSGVMGPHILSLIREAAAEAQAAGEAVSEHLDVTTKAIKTVQDELVKGMTLIERAGSFAGTVEVEISRVW